MLVNRRREAFARVSSNLRGFAFWSRIILHIAKQSREVRYRKCVVRGEPSIFEFLTGEYAAIPMNPTILPLSLSLYHERIKERCVGCWIIVSLLQGGFLLSFDGIGSA
jgi:hypothetical protein